MTSDKHLLAPSLGGSGADWAGVVRIGGVAAFVAAACSLVTLITVLTLGISAL